MAISELLLIEDNPAEVFLFREALRRLACAIHITIAYDGKRGLELLRDASFRPDLVVLDLNLPVMDGHSVLAAAQLGGSPPTVVFSNSSDPRDRARAISLGAGDYVVKPRTLEEYAAAVRAIVEKWLDREDGAAAGG